MLLGVLTWRSIAPGETITLGGSVGGAFHALAVGQVGAHAAHAEPGAPLAHLMLPGCWWGAGPLIGSARMLDGVARTEVLLGSIPLSRLETLLDSRAGGWRALAQLSEEWVALSSLSYVDAIKPDKHQRAAATLLRLSGLRPPLYPAPGEALHLSHEEFAGMVNLSRSTASSVLGDLANKGWIDLGYRTISVRAPAALGTLADGA